MGCLCTLGSVDHKKRTGIFSFLVPTTSVIMTSSAAFGVAVAEYPAGPFTDYLGKPLIGQIINGAQPIDQFAFRDTGRATLSYLGGWRHCNIGRLNDDFTGFIPYEDGTLFKSITS